MTRRVFVTFAVLGVGIALGYIAATMDLFQKSVASPVIQQPQTNGSKEFVVALADHKKPSHPKPSSGKKPNIVYFLVDNLGYGELGCYGGGLLRGTKTPRIDQFAKQGMRLMNFAPESQCTPSRSALMTGRYSIRSGNQTVMLAGSTGGLVAWEKTIADMLTPFGYVCYIVGKWHLGDSDGRWPTDHGFASWYGIPHSYDECLWANDPWYNPQRDGVSRVLEGRKGEKMKELEQLTEPVRRDIDLEFMKRAKASIKTSVHKGEPFFLYFNHSMMHLPTIPRAEFKGKTGNGDFADCLKELDSDFGELLDYLQELGVADNTIVVFSGDNGAEELLPWRGTSGFFEGSYFAGSEGNLRTPCIVRYPGKVPAGTENNEIVHITDMFPTLLRWAGTDIPKDRVIDGKDQRAFFEGKQEKSAREGFPYWMNSTLYGVKWGNFKLKLVDQKYLTDPAKHLPTPHLINLVVDPKEREPYNYPHMHSWVLGHTGKILREFEESVQREPLIPVGAALDYVPKKK
jgi:arylsulfatase A-like enzyme